MSKKVMEKATAAVEDIFSHAVALAQANRLKNTIYCIERDIYVLNFDNTILLRFTIPEWDKPFNNPVSFAANDYDSHTFYEEDGKIVFVSEVGGVERKKSITAPGASVEEIVDMFEGYEALEACEMTFHRKIVEALDEKLSHIEISVRNGEWKIIQRDIYSGSLIEITELKKGLGIGKGKIKEDVGPIGIRTNDFIALFNFNERVTFSFDPKCPEYASVYGKKYDMEGTLAFCIYDEIGDITPTKTKEEVSQKEEEPDNDPEPEEKPKRGRRSQKKEEKPKRGRRSQEDKKPEEEKPSSRTTQDNPKRKRRGVR